MAYYRSVGEIPRKRHTQHRTDDGRLLLEELVGAEGFSSDSALFYHREIPSAVTAARTWDLCAAELVTNHPLRARHLQTSQLAPPAGDGVITGRVPLLANADVTLSYLHADQPSPLYRNAGADECVFLQSGAARLETSFGAFDARPGDFVALPRGTTHRWIPAAGEPIRALVIVGRGHIAPPKRYLTAHGQFLEQSPYCERDLRAPDEPLLLQGEDVDVYVRHGDLGSILTYAHHPFDVVGWDGCLYPYAVNVDDFEPITGRLHQPPPVHQVFEAPGFVICAFVPRKVDYHPAAIPSPYYHSNIDSDEVIFYAGGDYGARAGSGISTGSISLHPAGQPHGPQPGAYERSIGVTEVDELAVMVDTFAPLSIATAALGIEDETYPWSWAR